MITSAITAGLHVYNLAVGRTYIISSFENKLLLGPKVKLSLLILHPFAARSWYLEGVTAHSRERSLLELIFPKNCHRSSPVEVQNSPKRSRSLRAEKSPVTLDFVAAKFHNHWVCSVAPPQFVRYFVITTAETCTAFRASVTLITASSVKS